MPNTYQIGRVGRVYVASESAYGTAATLVAGDAVRHLNVKLNDNPRNRVNSPERHTHPSQVYRFTRKRTADWLLSGIFYPSGIINTDPDHEPIITNTFGTSSKRSVTLSTTVMSGATTTGCVVASATGLAIGDAVLINVTTASVGRCVRFLTNVSGTTLTWAPALPSAPTVGDTVKGCVTWTPKTAIGSSMNIAHYLTSKSYEAKGCAPESFKLSFDENSEVMWEAGGPAQKRIRPAQSDPATFTTAGTTPPSGLTGSLRVDATAEEFLKATFEIKNGIALDVHSFGISEAQAMYRRGKREVTMTLDALDSNDVTIQDAADNTTDVAVLLQCGLTEGSIIAVYCPKVELDVPDDPNNDETQQHGFKGICKASASGNDEIYLAVA